MIPGFPQGLMALVMGMVAFVWLFALVRLRIVLFLGVTITCWPVIIVATIIANYLVPMPPMSSQVAFWWAFLGAVLGIAAHYSCEAWVSYEFEQRNRLERASGGHHGKR
jgi:uncharacterized protein YqgC (DUF456 family)